MQYKGYVGSVEFSENDAVLYGKVQGIRSLISYEGTTVQELLDDFHGAVDDYLALCEAEGTDPGLYLRATHKEHRCIWLDFFKNLSVIS